MQRRIDHHMRRYCLPAERADHAANACLRDFLDLLFGVVHLHRFASSHLPLMPAHMSDEHFEPAQQTAVHDLVAWKQSKDTQVLHADVCAACKARHGVLSTSQELRSAWVCHHLPPARRPAAAATSAR